MQLFFSFPVNIMLHHIYLVWFWLEIKVIMTAKKLSFSKSSITFQKPMWQKVIKSRFEKYLCIINKQQLTHFDIRWCIRLNKEFSSFQFNLLLVLRLSLVHKNRSWIWKELWDFRIIDSYRSSLRCSLKLGVVRVKKYHYIFLCDLPVEELKSKVSSSAVFS